MRYVVLLLILANLGVFAWRQWVYVPVEPEPILAAGVVELEIAPLQPETVFTPLPLRIFPDLELPSFGQIPQANDEEEGLESGENAQQAGAEDGSPSDDGANDDGLNDNGPNDEGPNDDGFEEDVLEEGLEEESFEEDLEEAEIEEDAGAEVVEEEGGAEPVEAQGEVQE